MSDDTMSEPGSPEEGFGVQVIDLGVRYGDTTALEQVSFTLAAGRIHGLLGRNGSGKSSLLGVLAGLRRPTRGQVLVDGEDPFENARVMAGSCLIRESGDVIGRDRVHRILDFASALRPHWDGDLAARLVERFELPLNRRADALSRGQRSALAAVLGLAARSPLTMLDEVYLGMDVPTRYAFYDELLADYIAHPRTILLSSHLIGEMEQLLEGVLVLDRGRILLDDDAEALRARGVSVTGPADAVDGFVIALTLAGGRALSDQRLGRTKQVTVFGGLDADPRDPADPADPTEPARRVDNRALAVRLGVELGPVPLQDLFVHLTDRRPVDQEVAR